MIISIDAEKAFDVTIFKKTRIYTSVSLLLSRTQGYCYHDVQNSLMDSVGEGEGGKIWENGIETCKISCMK